MNSELNNISNKGIENDNLIISNPELGRYNGKYNNWKNKL